MKLNYFRLTRGLTLGSLALAGFLLNGCSSTDSPAFSDTLTPPMGAVTSPTSSPATSQPAPDAEVARFHVGDTVIVTLSGIPDETLLPHQEPIKEDGTIDMPDIGKVQAAGKTAGELQDEIHDRYVPGFYTHITVTVNTGDRVYYVRGEVKQPGRQLYVGETTVTKAITSAGDFTDFANHRKVRLIRANGTQIVVNCNRVMNGDETDPPVYPGDQIVVLKSIW